MKILQIIGSMDIGGSQNLLMNIYSNIDRNNYQFDFLVFQDKKFDFDEKLKELGGNLIYIDSPSKIGMGKFIKKVKKLCIENKYDIVHAHTLFNCGPCVFAAYLAGIKIRISHSHSTRYLDEKITIKKRIYFFLSKLLINLFSTHYFACGIDAGKFLYFKNKKVLVLNNGIDIDKFSFNNSNRSQIRKQYNIKNEDILIGHVGRLMYIKNQAFLIDIINKLDKNYKLMLVGGGEDEKKLVEKVSKLKLENRVIFIGDVNNANEYYSAFDLFCFPSLHEGIPFTVIEAQANGLSIIASENISNECNVSETIHFFPIDDVNLWVDKIKKVDYSRKDFSSYIDKKGYSIKSTVETLKKIYTSNL